jgi:hypothetical protein
MWRFVFAMSSQIAGLLLAQISKVVDAVATAMQPRYRTTPMLPRYVGENVPGNKIWFGGLVRYLTRAERASYLINFRDGLIYTADDVLLDTRDALSLHSEGRAIFVMTATGAFYVSKYQMVGEFHHSSLVAGEPVAAAGELEVVRGTLIALSDRSGHYLPSQEYTRQAIDRLERNHISMVTVTLDLIGAA